MPVHDDLTGRTVSHFRILEKLGQGGMGVVYKAVDTQLNRSVALKFLPSDLSADSLEHARFRQEALAISSLNHPNIATIHGFEEEGGRNFIVFEYLPGGSVKAKLKDGPPPLPVVLEYAAQITRGLAHAHDRGIIHRDIKTENILIAGDGRLRITDFGLAKLRGGSSLTRTGSTVGTAAYMSPEQARGLEVDGRSDIFSLGVVLYEILTGRLPFTGQHEAALLYEIVHEEARPVRDLRPDAPEGLAGVIERAMAKKPDDRYQSAGELLADVERLIGAPGGGMEPGRVSIPLGVSIARVFRKPGRPVVFASGVLALALLAWLSLTILTETPGPVPLNRKTIAVLPMKNLVSGPEPDFFSEGVTEDLITQLSKIPDLTVIARSSILGFKDNPRPVRQVGAMLDAGSVLESSIRRQGDRIRISAQLVDAGSGTHLWAGTYDRELTDIFAIQTEVALEVSRALQSALTPETERRLRRQYTGNIEAYKAYLQGRLAWNEYSETGYKRAIDYFNTAIELDPTYPLAHAGLADAYYGMSNLYLPPSIAIPKARKAASRALELDESVAEAHTSMAIINAQIDWDWAGAERGYRRALELQPGYATAHQYYGWLLMYRGRFDDAMREVARAAELDPLSPFIAASVSWLTYMKRDYDSSIVLSRSILLTDSTSILARHNLGMALLQKGMYGEAIGELLTVVRLDPDNAFRLATLGYAYGKAGKADEAREVLRKLRAISLSRHVDPTAFALVHIGLGEFDLAFHQLDRALEARTEELLMLKVDPFYDRLRTDQRYNEMVKTIGLE